MRIRQPLTPSRQQRLRSRTQSRPNTRPDRRLQSRPRLRYARTRYGRRHLPSRPRSHAPAPVDIVVEIEHPPCRRPAHGRPAHHHPERVGPVPRLVVSGAFGARQRHTEGCQQSPPRLAPPRPRWRERSDHVEEAPHVRTPDRRVHDGETDIDWLGLSGLGRRCRHDHRHPLSAPVGQRNRAGDRTRSRGSWDWDWGGCWSWDG